MIEVGDYIKTEVGGPYEVIKIEDNGIIWFRLKDKSGVGQTILSNIIEIK